MSTTLEAPASAHGKQVLDDLSPLHRQLRRAVPDVYAGFRELHRAAFAPGALDAKTKTIHVESITAAR